MNFKEAQQWVKEEMVAVLDDDYPDTLDALSVRLEDEFGFSNKEAEDVVFSDWWA